MIGLLVVAIAGLLFLCGAQKLRIVTLKEQMNFYKQNMGAELHEKTSKVLEESGKKFSERSDLVLQNLLTPLKQEIESFRKKTEALHHNMDQGQTSLQTYIKTLHEDHNRLSNSADSLSRALTSSAKTRGNWGETALERMLEQCGLKEGHDYEKQVNVKKDGGGSSRPDFVVYLPQKRAIVIDAKCNLNHWVEHMEAVNAQSDSQTHDAADQSLNEHVKAMRASFKDLASKDYSTLLKGNTLEIVFMYVPIETAYIAAMEREPDLQNEAIRGGVAMVSPTTLYSVLNLVKQLWRIQAQSENAEKIALQGGKIYDKVHALKEGMEKVGEQLDKAKETWQLSFNRMSDGKDNLLTQTKKLQELGVSSKKQISPD